MRAGAPRHPGGIRAPCRPHRAGDGDGARPPADAAEGDRRHPPPPRRRPADRAAAAGPRARDPPPPPAPGRPPAAGGPCARQLLGRAPYRPVSGPPPVRRALSVAVAADLTPEEV